MALSLASQNKIRNFYGKNRALYLGGILIKSGVGRSVEIKEANYLEISANLLYLKINNMKADIEEASRILGSVLGGSINGQVLARTVEVQAPPIDNGAARKLARVIGDTAFQASLTGIGAPVGVAIDVRLDNDQLKHQHPKVIIGTRKKGDGNRFIQTACTTAAHQTSTMQHMANWAQGLVGMVEGEQRYHGQTVPVNMIHYEGFCLLANGQKYVLFHCYPSHGSPLKL